MSSVLPVKPGGAGGITWPMSQGGQASTVIDRSGSSDLVLSAQVPGLLLPSQQERDYTLAAPYELTTAYKPLPLVEAGASFFARHMSNDSSVPAELLQQLLLENVGQEAAAQHAAMQGNRLAAVSVQLPIAESQEQRRQQQQRQCSQGMQDIAAATGCHADKAIVVVSTAGSIGQLLCVSVIQPGPVPAHLAAGLISSDYKGTAHGPDQAAASQAMLQSCTIEMRKRKEAGAAQTEPEPGTTAGSSNQGSGCIPVEVHVNRAAVLDTGSTIHQVAAKRCRLGYAGTTGTARVNDRAADTAATAARGDGIGRQQQQVASVALLLVRCMYKLYIAEVSAIRQAASTQSATATVGSAQACSTAAAATTTKDCSWQLQLMGVAVLPRPLLTAEWHPQLQQVLVGCDDGTVWLVEADKVVIPHLCDTAAVAAAAAGPSASTGASNAGGEDLHPDKQLPLLPTELLGQPICWPAAAASAPRVADGSSWSRAPTLGTKLLLQFGCHPRQVLAACGDTLAMQSISMRSAAAIAGCRGAAGGSSTSNSIATAGSSSTHSWPGRLLLQLPPGEAVCSMVGWQNPGGQQQQHQRQEAAAATAVGVVHVRHLLAVATNKRLLLLDLRKAGSEPLLIWQHGMWQEPPSMLLLLPTPHKPRQAAKGCGRLCFQGRCIHEQRLSGAAQAVTAVVARQSSCSNSQSGEDARQADANQSSASQSNASQIESDPAIGAGNAWQGFDPEVYPSQMFAPENQLPVAGFGGSMGWLMATQASQIADAAASAAAPAGLRLASLKQQQRQQLLGQGAYANGQLGSAADASQAHLPSPQVQQQQQLSGGGPAAAAAVQAGQVVVAAGTAQVDDDSNWQPGDVHGTVVYAASNSGEVHSLNFRLRTHAALQPNPLSLDHRTAAALHSTATATKQLLSAHSAAASSTGSTGAALAGGPGTGQVPGLAALKVVTASMEALALKSAAPAAVAVAGNAAAAGVTTSGAPLSKTAKKLVRCKQSGLHAQQQLQQYTQQQSQQQRQQQQLRIGKTAGVSSPLGCWQLPVVMQVITPGPGKLLAGPIESSVQSVQRQRAAAAVTALKAGNSTAAAEATLLPGAALDVSTAAAVSQYLSQAAAAPDTAGLALTSLPWCWTGGLARALLLRCNTDGDLLLQLCNGQQPRLAITKIGAVVAARVAEGAAAAAETNKLGSTAAAAATAAVGGGGDGGHGELLALKPLLVLAAADAMQPNQPACESAQQPACDIAAHHQQQHPIPGLLPHGASSSTNTQAITTSQVKVADRGFAAVEAWLDNELEPLQLASEAAIARASGPSSAQAAKDKHHIDRQLVQLPAHIDALLQGLHDAQIGQQQLLPGLNGQRQQNQRSSRVKEIQQMVPAGTLLPAGAPAKAAWPQLLPRTSRGASGTATAPAGANQGSNPFRNLREPWTARAAAAAAAAADEISRFYPGATLWQYPATLTAAPSGNAPAAGASRRFDAANVHQSIQLVTLSKWPVTLLEVRHKQLMQQQRQHRSGQHVQQQQQRQQSSSGNTVGLKRSSVQVEQQAEDVLWQQQEQQVNYTAADAASAHQGGLRQPLPAVSGPPGSAVTTRLAKLRQLRSQEQQEQRHRRHVAPPYAGLHAQGSAHEHAGGAATAAGNATVNAEVAATATGAGPPDANELRRLLRQQVAEPYLQVAAQLLCAQGQGAAAAKADSFAERSTAAAALGAGAQSRSRSSKFQEVMSNSSLQALLTSIMQQPPQQQQQQEQPHGAEQPGQHQQQQPSVQMRKLKLPCLTLWQDTTDTMQQQPCDALELHGPSSAQPGRVLRYTVAAVGPGAWQHDRAQGMEEAGIQVGLPADAVVLDGSGRANLGHASQKLQQPSRLQPAGLRQGMAAVADADESQISASGQNMLPAECALHGVLLEAPPWQLLDVTPRYVLEPRKSASGARSPAGLRGAAAAVHAASQGGGSSSKGGQKDGASEEVVRVRAPPGLLALSMSRKAQQRWLQLADEWTEDSKGGVADVHEQQQQQQQGGQLEKGTPPAAVPGQSRARGRLSGTTADAAKQGVAAAAVPPRMQAGIGARAQPLGLESTASPSHFGSQETPGQHVSKKPKTGNAASTGQQTGAAAKPGLMQLLQPTGRQQQQQAKSATAASQQQQPMRLSQPVNEVPASQQSQQQLPTQQQPSALLARLSQQQQQQQQPQVLLSQLSLQHQQPHSLLSQLSSQQQQQQQHRPGATSLLMPTSRRR